MCEDEREAIALRFGADRRASERPSVIAISITGVVLDARPVAPEVLCTLLVADLGVRARAGVRVGRATGYARRSRGTGDRRLSGWPA